VVSKRVAHHENLSGELISGEPIDPSTMFRALRMQPEMLGYPPAAVVNSLLALRTLDVIACGIAVQQF
jgi:hypothetical protein